MVGRLRKGVRVLVSAEYWRWQGAGGAAAAADWSCGGGAELATAVQWQGAGGRRRSEWCAWGERWSEDRPSL